MNTNTFYMNHVGVFLLQTDQHTAIKPVSTAFTLPNVNKCCYCVENIGGICQTKLNQQANAESHRIH